MKGWFGMMVQVTVLEVSSERLLLVLLVLLVQDFHQAEVALLSR